GCHLFFHQQEIAPTQHLHCDHIAHGHFFQNQGGEQVSLVDRHIHAHILVEKPGVFGVVHTGNGTVGKEFETSKRCDNQVGFVISSDCRDHVHFSDTGSFENVGVGSISDGEHFFGQVQQNVIPFFFPKFNQPNFMVFFDQFLGKVCADLSTTNNHY